MMYTGLARRFRARSALVTITHVALSVSRQQSSRCSGLQIHRDASTSSTVTRSFSSAFGFCDACELWATRTWATWADVVPYSYMWRMKVGAKFCPALRRSEEHTSELQSLR